MLVSGNVRRLILIQNLFSALVQKGTICMSGCPLYSDPRVPRTRAESSSLTSTSPPSTPSSLQKWPSEHEFTTATSTPRGSFALTFSKTTGVQLSQFLRYVLKISKMEGPPQPPFLLLFIKSRHFITLKQSDVVTLKHEYKRLKARKCTSRD